MTKYMHAHGLGNDYLVIHFLHPGITLTPSVIRRICDRHLGPGGDGILWQVPSSTADFGLRIFNPDGSEAEKSGNGLRIFARFLYETGQLQDVARIETLGGIVQARPLRRDGRLLFQVDMGKIEVLVQHRPESPPIPWLDQALSTSRGDLTGSALSIGNPHFVMFSDTLKDEEVTTLGPLVECHPAFPNRTNVQFARVIDEGNVEARIWERGAGVTLASGSSACAVAAAGLLTGRLGQNVRVHMPGGMLEVFIDDRLQVRQTGPVTLISEGILGGDLEEELVALSRADQEAGA